MQSGFSDVVEQVKALSFEEKAELKFLLESYLIKERREEIYQNYKMTKEHEGEFAFSADLNKHLKNVGRMIEIAFSPSFKKAFRKKIKGQPDLETKFWQRAEMFMQNPFDEWLRTHNLSGKLRELVKQMAVDYA